MPLKHTASLSKRLYKGSAVSALAIMLFSSVAHTQDISENLPEDDVQQLQTITVVGSQIAGARITGALPVTTVGEDQIASIGATSGNDLFRAIPEAGDITFNGTYLGGGNSNAARGDVSTVSLRGLAQGNTLLLLNGRRSVVHPTTQTDNSTPVFGYNVNAVPVAGLQRVEILKDGAAALYGSDAVAGVVNNVLKSDFKGLDVDMQYGFAEDTNMKEWTANLLYGTDFGGGKGNISVFFGTTQQTALLNSDQDYTATQDLRSYLTGTSFEGNTAFDTRSTASAWGGFSVVGATAPVSVGGVPVTDAAGFFHIQPNTNAGCLYDLGNGTCIDDGQITTNADRNLRRDQYTATPGHTVLPELERYNFFSFVNYELTPEIRFFGELGAYYAKTESITGSTASLGTAPIFVPATNYYNPIGEDLQIRSYSYVDTVSRKVEVENNQFRLLGGLRGEKFGWNWETAALYNEATVKDGADGIDGNLLAAALALTTPDAYNPFNGGDLSNLSGGDATPSSQSAIDSFLIWAVRENKTALSLVDFKVSKADLFNLPGGPVGVAGGLEYRRETYKDDRDPHQDTSIPYVDPLTGFTNGSSLLGHSPREDVKGSRNVTSAFAEFAVPVISPEMGIPLVQAIDLQFAGRYEDYSDVGSVAKPKVAGSWDVVDGLRLRSSWSQGFKAPNLEVINLSVQAGSNARTDYVRCEADLIAGRITSFAGCTRSFGVTGLRAGNANLVPEESESLSYGVVFEPQFIPDQFGNFVFTVDRWRIEQEGIVGVPSDVDAIALDYLLRMQGSSNPAVVRDTPTPQEIADFAGTGLAPVGEILYVNLDFQNLLPLEVEGIDFGLVYDVKLGPIGDLRLNVNATKLLKYYQDPSSEQLEIMAGVDAGTINAAVPVVRAADLIGSNGNPEWKWTVSATWSKDNWQVGAFTKYTDEVYQTTVLDADLNPWAVESQITTNLYGQYRVETDGPLSDTTFRVGVRNITNEKPPLATGGYLSSLYQPVPRYWYASVKKSF